MLAMPAKRIQIQPRKPDRQFMGGYGTEERCESALEQIRWAEGSYLSSMRGENAWPGS